MTNAGKQPLDRWADRLIRGRLQASALMVALDLARAALQP